MYLKFKDNDKNKKRNRNELLHTVEQKYKRDIDHSIIQMKAEKEKIGSIKKYLHQKHKVRYMCACTCVCKQMKMTCSISLFHPLDIYILYVIIYSKMYII